jgi:hypothetical protein
LLDNRPLVLYSDIESEEWVYNYLKINQNQLLLHRCVLPNAKDVRGMKIDLTQDIINQLQNSGHTPILCLSSKYEYDINYKNTLKDLCIENIYV